MGLVMKRQPQSTALAGANRQSTGWPILRLIDSVAVATPARVGISPQKPRSNMNKKDRLALRKSIAEGVLWETGSLLVPTDELAVQDEWQDGFESSKAWKGPEVVAECEAAMAVIRKAMEKFRKGKP